MDKILKGWVLLAGLVYFGCNAPHNNPLDPYNINKSLGSISGIIETQNIPFQGIAGVQVIWNGQIVVTDNDGKFVFRNLERTDGFLLVMKDGFYADSVKVEWGNSNYVEKTINLNSMPGIKEFTLVTSIIHTLDDALDYQLDFSIDLIDLDKDIDSIYISSNLNSNLYPVQYNSELKKYTAQLGSKETNQSIYNLEGIAFYLNAMDISGKTYVSEPKYISRIIDDGAEAVSPIDATITDSTPVLKWTKINIKYDVYYTIEIYTNNLSDSKLVYTKENIDSNILEHLVEVALPNDQYFWVIYTIDRLNNKFRSKPVIFTII